LPLQESEGVGNTPPPPSCHPIIQRGRGVASPYPKYATTPLTPPSCLPFGVRGRQLSPYPEGNLEG